jgi:hypothetical protein
MGQPEEGTDIQLVQQWRYQISIPYRHGSSGQTIKY